MMKMLHWPRYMILALAFTLAGLGILIRAVNLQTNSKTAQQLIQAGQQRDLDTKQVERPRGNIYDAYGNVLAANSLTYEIGLDLTKDNISTETVAAQISAMFGSDYNTLLDTISYAQANGLRRATLKRYASPEKMAEILLKQQEYADMAVNSDSKTVRGTSLLGVDGIPMLARYYPEGSLASNVLGTFPYWEGSSAQGYYGVEGAYHDLLTSPPQQLDIPNNPLKMAELAELQRGDDLILTIDRSIQMNMEEILDKAVEKWDADGGVILVMDPRTGEMLAMASTPRQGHNNLSSSLKLYDLSVSALYEPGSVFKVLTMAAALDAGLVTPDTTFVDNGVFYHGGYPIYNWDRAGHGEVSMTTCMELSLNVCLAHLAVDVLKPEKFYEYIQAFGIGRKTGIDLEGEGVYPLRLPGDENYYDVDLATNSFGQGVSVTPIQMMTAISAVANDGKIMVPHVLKARIHNGVRYDTHPQVMAQPISAATARTLSSMLAVALENEASTALVEGYRLAGKTGTAEVPSENSAGYKDGIINASFVGWGPIDDPRFVVYIWLKEPKEADWASESAAPVFAEVVKSLVVSLRLPPDAVRLQMQAVPTATAAP
ncbi:MAG TPA: penicillin-binding protein 2 [Anaerolineaceae bacterium]|nr:penicillin-binding protein 2 [Anaerolineaceae bacterium]HPN51478.1 penicillin-binding protein 2 [Anaerolineaceae bacterium]